jgi:hypothetical protein
MIDVESGAGYEPFSHGWLIVQAVRKDVPKNEKAATMTCAALLASYFAGVQIANLDKSIVYEVPSSFQTRLSWSAQKLAKACAYKHGIRWRLVEGR